MTKFSRAVLGAALLAVSGFAAAASYPGIVDAKGNSLGGGSAFDTGVFLVAGETFSVTANPADLWDNSGTDPTYVSNADGHAFQMATLDGLTDAIGSLVGEIGNGPLFNVGTNLANVTAGSAGELKLFYFDSDADNNTGFVHVDVSAVPEPTNIALMALALGAFALTRRRKA
ncbi:PEP-CTERM sorting domain-containing protein [Scleromatobacter humisilvae]|uniref:PEP-CTERM sorting domain-containing protein n=1 Tax=Scleromatobacter humisilvae TaxID=2897159 RepID=A0A9X1YGW6_9BURK|nr:PEP-CTERM sorting domain-containing protein [Scleromatobacter humisilvae]MCK9684187.1 PEP-CTERM sorting domain-containing protein [Scleromatobacter humisilvae]